MNEMASEQGKPHPLKGVKWTPERRAAQEAATARRRAKKPGSSAAVSPSDDAEWAGFTEGACCLACTQPKCVITGTDFCGHPVRNSMQTAILNRPGVMERWEMAKRILAHQAADKK